MEFSKIQWIQNQFKTSGQQLNGLELGWFCHPLGQRLRMSWKSFILKVLDKKWAAIVAACHPFCFPFSLRLFCTLRGKTFKYFDSTFSRFLPQHAAFCFFWMETTKEYWSAIVFFMYYILFYLFSYKKTGVPVWTGIYLDYVDLCLVPDGHP